MDYKYFGLLAFLLLVAGLVFVIWKWPQGKHKTFSQHVAVAESKILYYIVLFTIVLPLLLLFFLQWFVPTFQLPALFSISMVVASTTQYACTLIPEIEGWKTTYHRIFAGISAVSLLPPLGLLLVSPNVFLLEKCVVFASLTAMLGVLALIIKSRGQHEYLLILQSSYFAAFFVPVLFIAYFR